MYILEFSCQFDCIIALNSKLPHLGFFINFFLNTPVIGADGGAVNLFHLGIIADFVVGDLDTFDKAKIQKYFKREQIVYEPDQEKNDFEKAIIFALSKNYKNILVLGFHGGELEHTLNNWSIIKKYQNKTNLCIFDQGRYAIPIDYDFMMKCKYGELISIIPQPYAKLQTSNLQWNLNGEILEFGTREGARNIATNNNFTIKIFEGSILLFIDARIPNCYEKKSLCGPDEIRTHDL